MKRRDLLAVTSGGMLVGTSGCLDALEAVEGTGQEDEDGAETSDTDNENDTNNEEQESTSFKVSDLNLEVTTIAEGESIDISATIINTGDTAGSQEIELRITASADPDHTSVTRQDLTIDPDEEDLIVFKEVELNPESYSIVVTSEDDEAIGTLLVSALAEQIEACEAEAMPLEYESQILNRSGHSEIFSEGVHADDPDPLHQIASETFSTDRTIRPLFGYTFTSEEEAEQLDRGALNEHTIYSGPPYEAQNGGSEDETSAFIDETDFDMQSLLLFRYSGVNTPTFIEVESVGELSDETYVRVTRRTGPAEGESQGVTLVRVDDPDPSDPLLAGELFGYLTTDYDALEGVYYPALHSNQEAE